MSDCKLDIERGCYFCNCDSEEEAYAKPCESCNKLGSFDWLGDVDSASENSTVEVRFKNTRKGYYKNVNGLSLSKGDIVAVEASPGHDIGIVSMTGDMVALQMKRTGFNPEGVEFKKIYRKAKPYDIVKWQEAIALEHQTMIRSRQIAASLGLNMKIGDVEYQGDKIKAIFYYIADERVDFRELIKIFAEEFRIRIEMKQIGARQEAGRIGGIGSCGRELCCSTWVSNFVSVTTNSARFQEISLNPQKLAGQCGKLKCCLNYEVDAYIDARKDFPRINAPLETVDAQYYLVKTDILKRLLSFSSDPQSMMNIVTIPVERVKEIIRLNRKGIKVEKLQEDERELPVTKEPDFKNVVGEESITRFDNSGRSSRRRRGGNNRGGTRQEEKENMRTAKTGFSDRNEESGDKGERMERQGQRRNSNQSGNDRRRRPSGVNRRRMQTGSGGGVQKKNIEK